MQCPNCSLRMNDESLVCGRCGELTPRPTGLSFDTRPPATAQPKMSQRMNRSMSMDRRGQGLRALSIVAKKTSKLPPARSRMRMPTAGYRPVQEHQSQGSLALAPSAARAAQPSMIHHAKTEPFWIQEPEQEVVHAQLNHSAIREALAQELRIAGVLERIAAGFIDLCVIVGCVGLTLLFGALVFGFSALAPYFENGFDYAFDALFLGHQLGLLSAGLFAVFYFAYTTVSHALTGATVGKKLIGLRVEKNDGHRLGFGESAVRTILSGFSTGCAGIGIAYTIFDAHKNAPHDHLLGTRVVRETAPFMDDTKDDSHMIQ